MRQFNKYPQAKLLFIALIGVSLVVLFMRTSGGVLATESGWWASLWHDIVNPAETTANALTTVFLDLITFPSTLLSTRFRRFWSRLIATLGFFTIFLRYEIVV